MAAMTPDALKAILQAEKLDALGTGGTGTLASERTKAMDYYLGDVSADMPSQDGRSKAVSTDVADTIEGLMPSLMEIFASTEEVVRFEPVGPEDEQAAMQETDYVNHVFMQKNPGFLTLYTFIKDALLSKVGVVKVWYDKGENEERETYLDQDQDSYTAIISDPGVEEVEHNKNPDGTHDVTVVSKKPYGCARVEPVPPEEFGISRRAKNIHDCGYCYHEVMNSEDELIDQGFDAKQVKALPTATVANSAMEAQARDTVEDTNLGGAGPTGATRTIRTTEHYIKIDYSGEGKSGLYRVTTGGEQGDILKRDGKEDINPVDVMPFAAMTPVIMTHRFFGRSIADLVMDIQRIKTALLRQMLDNAYLTNNPRTEVAESHSHERTLDDLLVNRPGGLVRTKLPGGINVIPTENIGPQAQALLEYVDATREWRTGVTRQGQGIDANALQNQSATAVNQAFSAAQARMKLIARIFAETGVRDLFSLLHGTIRKNETQAATVRLRNKWVQVDPRNWKTRDDMTVKVGLGTGSRQEEVANLMNILNIQKEMLLNGLPTVSPKNVYNSASKLTEKVGEKNPEQFFTDPESPEGQQMAQAAAQKPNPDVMKLQMQAQLDQQTAQHKAQIETVQAQADIATANQKIAAETQQTDREFQLKAQLAQMQAQLDLEKFNREEARKDQEHQQQLGLRVADHKMKITEAGMSQQGEGGDIVSAQDAAQQRMEKLMSHLGDHLAQHSAQMQHLTQTIAQSHGPKRARKGTDGSWTVETVQH